jgi:hypothetical protein
MAETLLEPRISALLVAQDAFRDEHGRVHVHGIFDTIASPKFPLTTGFKVFVAFKGTKRGTYQAMVRLLDSLDNKLAETEQMTFELTEFKGHNLFLNFGIRFPSPQLYKIKLFVDGIERLEMPLMVREVEAAPPQS